MALIDPPEIVGLVEIDPFEVTSAGGLEWLQLVGNDSQRLYLVVITDPATADFWLWPNTESDGTGIRPGADLDHVLIHYASYPGLCQGPWFGWLQNVGQTLKGYAVRRH